MAPLETKLPRGSIEGGACLGRESKRGVQRKRKEDRDQDPGENLARDPDDVEQERNRDRDPEHRKDRGGPEADNSLLHVKAASRQRRTFWGYMTEAGGGNRTRVARLEP